MPHYPQFRQYRARPEERRLEIEPVVITPTEIDRYWAMSGWRRELERVVALLAVLGAVTVILLTAILSAAATVLVIKL